MLRILRRDDPDKPAEFAGTYDAKTKQLSTSDKELRAYMLNMPELVPVGPHGVTYGPDHSRYEAAVGDYIDLVSGWLFII